MHGVSKDVPCPFCCQNGAFIWVLGEKMASGQADEQWMAGRNELATI